MVPEVRNADGSYTELGALSAEPWPEFINKFSDNAELNITLIHRKAFGDTKTMRGLHVLLEKQEFLFTHAILYVHDMHGNHAFYGFLPQSIVNDLLNRNVSHNYTAYKDLTITGTKQQTYALFEEIEKATKQPFTGIKFNCYTPIMTGLSKAREIGFKTPKDFDERLLVGVAQEQNGGAGMFYNKILGPVCDEAVKRTLGFQKMVTEPRPSGSVTGLVNCILLDLRRSLTVAARLISQMKSAQPPFHPILLIYSQLS